MPSSERSEPLDLERGLPTTREDAAALRRIRSLGSVATGDFLRFMAALEPPAYLVLRARRGPRGEPFRL